MENSDHSFTSEFGQPKRKHNFLIGAALHVMGSSPFEGGEIEGANGVIRVLSSHSSAYLVPTNVEQTEYFLIDAGMDKKAKQIRAELALRNLGADAVKAVCLTHGHTDHANGVAAFPGADIYIGQPDDNFMHGKVNGDGPLEQVLGPIERALGKRKSLAIADKLHILNEDEQTIVIGNKTIQAFAVPGHTRGNRVFVVDGILFAGDALTFNAKGEVNKPPFPVSHDVEMASRSLKRLVGTFDIKGIASDIQTVLPSHSGEGSFDAIRKFASRS